MLKTIVIDDEPIALEVIKSLTEKVTFVEMVGYFTNAFEAMGFLKPNPVDLIFLDIQMPDISGIDFLRSLPNPPMVIFTTAYSEHAVEGFEMDAVDYLLKPFSLTRFLKACNKAYEQHTLRKSSPASVPSQPFIYVKSGYENIRIEFNDILYAEALGNYVQLVLENKKIATRLTMNEAEVLLSARGFLRTHRSYIVSISNIQRFDKRSIWVRQTELPIGPLYLSEIEKKEALIFYRSLIKAKEMLLAGRGDGAVRQGPDDLLLDVAQLRELDGLAHQLGGLVRRRTAQPGRLFLEQRVGKEPLVHICCL